MGTLNQMILISPLEIKKLEAKLAQAKAAGDEVAIHEAAEQLAEAKAELSSQYDEE